VAATTFDPPLRVSVGLASWPHDAGDGETLLERADAALYAAKRGGKDRVRLVADVGASAPGDACGGERRRALEVARALELDDARAGEVEAVLSRVLGPALRAA
jgi:Diguanylate cyclase, GGDEF domain